ncbi:hypothetical protein PC128_g15493 [Phytophthora cactorum]|nr:hypothetical protein PC128_g15493 [Phytophthora cactorum]
MQKVHLKARAVPAQSLEIAVIPLPFTSTVLHHCTSTCWQYLGVNKTLDKVHKRAYWHDQKHDTMEYVRECTTCRSGKGCRPWRNGLMQKMPVQELSGPLALLVVDTVGLLATTPRGN